MQKTNNEKINFNIKMEKDIKDRFLKVAKANDTTAAQLIRHFIKDYISKNSQLSM